MGFDIYLRFVLAFAFTIALMAGIYWLIRRFGQKTVIGRMTMGGRIGLVEVAQLDARRRLALIRRDDVEHLVLFGLQGETVIETGIRKPTADEPRAETHENGKAGAP